MYYKTVWIALPFLFCYNSLNHFFVCLVYELYNVLNQGITLLCLLFREFLRLASPLNCGAWDKKLLKQYRVHKPSSLSYEPEMRSKLTFEIPFSGFIL